MGGAKKSLQQEGFALGTGREELTRNRKSSRRLQSGPCHTVFTSIEQATSLLCDERGNLIPSEDVCRVCREPFTINQKIALFNAIM